MAPLLQIAEPGMSPVPHKPRLAVGIDLGTTNSLAAAVKSGIAEVLPDEKGRALLPSVVRYRADGAVETGYQARAFQETDPQNTISSVKRLMGKVLKDIPAASSLPYRFADRGTYIGIQTAAGEKNPVEISAEILKTLKTRTEKTFGDDIAGAVITVPAYFDDAQRQATKDAAKLAGLHVLRLLNEPTAAAIAYGLGDAPEGLYAAYDLGGGTFDISILRLNKGVFEVLAAGGDSQLGGDDFDRALAAWISEKASLKSLPPEDRQALLTKARSAKEALSSDERTRISLPLSSGPVDLEVTAETFEALTADLVGRTVDLIRQTIRDADLAVSDIDDVILIGGATRMPHVRKALKAFFGKAPNTSLDPDKAVALGAAMQANLLAGNRAPGEDWLLLDVIPLSLGIETMGGLAEKIIPRNSVIPCAYTQEFTTFKDGQTALAVTVVQGERDLAADCRPLAKFELRGIKPMAAGVPRIKITFQVDADGLLSVSARENLSGAEASVTVKPSYGLTDTEITRMLEDSGKNAEKDMAERALREETVEAERTAAAVLSAMASDGDLLNEAEKAAIEALLRETAETVKTGPAKAIHEAVQRLAKGTEEFAARRMNRSIRAALAGKSLDGI